MNFTSNARWNILLPNIDIRDRKVKKYENIKFLTNIKTVSGKRKNHESYSLLALNTAVSFRLFDKIFLNGHWLNTSECWAAVSEICILICDWPQLTSGENQNNLQPENTVSFSSNHFILWQIRQRVTFNYFVHYHEENPLEFYCLEIVWLEMLYFSNNNDSWIMICFRYFSFLEVSRN